MSIAHDQNILFITYLLNKLKYLLLHEHQNFKTGKLYNRATQSFLIKYTALSILRHWYTLINRAAQEIACGCKARNVILI